ncbi:MAG: hypothetical protein HY983_04120 [Candidatus Magasanikbacteria bacterium]|nr:hypothetical protein [Candidatus Magasanikbacteria bacterium]
MNNFQLTRTLRLLRRTGDKAVVVDPGSDEVFMLMNLDAYEGLLDEIDCADHMLPTDSDALLDEDNLILDEDEIPAETPELPDEIEEISSFSSTTAVSRREAQPAGSQSNGHLDFSGDWPKPATSSLEKEESLEDVLDEGEEEKFYLEPIE